MANPLSSYLLTLEPTFDVLAAYASDNITMPATATEAWVAIGGFRTSSALLARLQVIGLVAPGVSTKVALFGPTKITESEVTIVAGSDTTYNSRAFEVDGQVDYIIAASCQTATAGDAYFGVVRTASLTAP
jgi:hypothetical protein